MRVLLCIHNNTRTQTHIETVPIYYVQIMAQSMKRNPISNDPKKNKKFDFIFTKWLKQQKPKSLDVFILSIEHLPSPTLHLPSPLPLPFIAPAYNQPSSSIYSTDRSRGPHYLHRYTRYVSLRRPRKVHRNRFCLKWYYGVRTHSFQIESILGDVAEQQQQQ